MHSSNVIYRSGSFSLYVRLTFTLVHIADLLARAEVGTRRGDITLRYAERVLGSLRTAAERGIIDAGGHGAGRAPFQTGGGSAMVPLPARGGGIHINPPPACGTSDMLSPAVDSFPLSGA